MGTTLNVRAANFARMTLFLAEPSDRDPTPCASLSVSRLAREFCERRDCMHPRMEQNAACRKHAQAMLLGVSKLIVSGELLAEMSHRGVVFVRLSVDGVLGPSEWSSWPGWFDERPSLIEWAECERRRERWEARV